MDFSGFLDHWLAEVENLFRLGASSVAPSLVTPYDQLPDAPAGPGDDSHVQNSLDDMTPEARAEFEAFEAVAVPSFASAGIELRRLETKRTAERQLWLWKIGRVWKAPGRDGIVTDVRLPSGPHGRGDAVDYNYRLITGTSADRDRILAALADQFSETLRWGGTFTLSSGDSDPAHWEFRR